MRILQRIATCLTLAIGLGLGSNAQSQVPIFEDCAPGGPIFNGPPIDIPIFVPNNFPVAGVQICVDISHPVVGDLLVEIQSPAGITIPLHVQQGGLQPDLVVTFSDFGVPNGSQPYNCGCCMQAQQPLDFLLGQPGQGAWTLRVFDSGLSGGGFLNQWCLQLYDLPLPPTFQCIPCGSGGPCDPVLLFCEGSLLPNGDVTLSWDNVSIYEFHEIFRDGLPIGGVPGDQNVFIDPAPGNGGHVYEVVSFCPGGQMIATLCTVEVGPPQVMIIPAGDDLWNTPCGTTRFSFCQDPIPPGFFNPGSEPFFGTIRLQGALGPSGLDTRMSRLQDMVLDGVGAIAETPIELVELSLVSCQPITVVTDGTPTQWDVAVGLSNNPGPLGTMQLLREHPNGGTFTANFFVQPVFVFTLVNNPLEVRTFEPPVVTEFCTFSGSPWVHTADPAIGGGGFAPGLATGVEEDQVTLEQCCRKIGHAGPGHLHETAPPDCSSCPGACLNPLNLECNEVENEQDCVDLGGIFLGPGSKCVDSDSDGLVDIIETNDCCAGFVDFTDTGTDPKDPDTDGDGVNDRDEVLAGTDVCAPETAPEFVRGDVNNNGTLDALNDALALLNFGFLGGAAPVCFVAADVNGDRQVTVLTDVLYLLSFGFSGGAAPPAPFPNCGADLNGFNALGCATPFCP